MKEQAWFAWICIVQITIYYSTVTPFVLLAMADYIPSFAFSFLFFCCLCLPCFYYQRSKRPGNFVYGVLCSGLHFCLPSVLSCYTSQGNSIFLPVSWFNSERTLPLALSHIDSPR